MQCYQDMPKEKRDEEGGFLAISGMHFEVQANSEDSIIVKDTSSNGTFVDGRRIEEVEFSDVSTVEHLINFGKEEEIVLRIVEVEEVPSEHAEPPDTKPEDAENPEPAGEAAAEPEPKAEESEKPEPSDEEKND